MATTNTSAKTSPGFLIFAAALIVGASLLMINFRFFITSGPSMEPTYTEGTFLLSSRLYRAPKVGEAVFLWNDGIYCLKRVAYVAGEDVSSGGHEGYWGSSIVPEGYVYVLGDNPGNSRDSRDPSFGLVALEDIWGKPMSQREKPTT